MAKRASKEVGDVVTAKSKDGAYTFECAMEKLTIKINAVSYGLIPLADLTTTERAYVDSNSIKEYAQIGKVVQDLQDKLADLRILVDNGLVDAQDMVNSINF